MESYSTLGLFQPKKIEPDSTWPSIILDLKNGSFEKLNAAADKYFSNLIPQKIPCVESLEGLLNTSFVLGETHKNISARSFLIKNIMLLKEAGFKTLFMENLFEEHQQDLDDYCLNPNVTQLSEELRWHVKKLDICNRCRQPDRLNRLHDRWEANNYSAVIKAAKQAGVRVVAVDTKETHSQMFKDMDENSNPGFWMPRRLKYMNFTASCIINQVIKNSPSDDKWLSLTGEAHTVTVDTSITASPVVAGLANIFGVPSIHICDTGALTLDQNIWYNEVNSIACADVTIKFSKRISIYILNNPFRDISLPDFLKMSALPEYNENIHVLTEDQFNDSVNKYVAYKNEYWGLRWFSTSDESKLAISQIICADTGQERYEIAREYVDRNPEKALSLQLGRYM